MKKAFFIVSLLTLLFMSSAQAAEQAPTLFPALHPGMSVEEAKAVFPKMNRQQEGAKGSVGFALPSTSAAGNIKLLFVEGKLALMTYEIKENKLPLVVKTAKSAYGESKEGDGVNTFKFAVGGSVLDISGEASDGGGAVTFVDPEAMKKIGRD